MERAFDAELVMSGPQPTPVPSTEQATVRQTAATRRVRARRRLERVAAASAAAHAAGVPF